MQENEEFREFKQYLLGKGKIYDSLTDEQLVTWSVSFDKKKDLLQSQTAAAVLLLPFEIPKILNNDVFPEDGFGSIVLQREHLVHKILALSRENQAIYTRAPRGCGKTSLLHLIGATLLSQGHKVFYIKTAANMTVNTITQMESLSNSCQADEKIYILIDDVHTNPNSSVWNYLIKEQHNFRAITFGIPDFGLSPYFYCKMKASEVFLTEHDLDENALSSFVQLGKSSHPHIKEENVKALYKFALSYSGGHVFPLLKMMEYLLSHPYDGDDRFCESHFRRILCGKEFYESAAFNKIKRRVFDFDPSVRSAAEGFIKTGKISLTDIELLDKYGYWTEGKKWIISDLMMFCLFDTNPNKQFVDTKALTLDMIIAKGLENFTNDNFIKRQHSNDGDFLPRFEIAVGHFFGWNLSGIKNLYVSPQRSVDTDDIGYYINGEHDTYVELILDSQSVKDKVELSDTYYKKKVYLDLKAHDDKIAKFPKGKDNIFYSFLMNQNALYKGNSLVKTGVSKHLPHYPVNDQRKMFTTLINATKRFVK